MSSKVILSMFILLLCFQLASICFFALKLKQYFFLSLALVFFSLFLCLVYFTGPLH